ncbi:hypothetical protein FUAX_43250 (plasmid) [Fulvitalea axinellae]|uniref:Uncharacterized protein n=2 Tax=Fulvitalea axinellae TaxID=1182444 RepID=A0AAU9CNL9_9BACT|nr:hypothetical protein FUAX_43250 [Fulvitalea axinellae]
MGPMEESAHFSEPAPFAKPAVPAPLTATINNFETEEKIGLGERFRLWNANRKNKNSYLGHKRVGKSSPFQINNYYDELNGISVADADDGFLNVTGPSKSRPRGQSFDEFNVEGRWNTVGNFVRTEGLDDSYEESDW